MSYADATLTRKRTTTTVEVEVEVDISDLEQNGWHHEDDCPDRQPVAVARSEDLTDAIRSLHRQAHPSQHPDALLCRELPCRDLDFDQLCTPMGRGGTP